MKGKNKIQIFSCDFVTLWFFLFFFIGYAHSGNIELIKQDSKYLKKEYLDFFKIPTNKLNFTTNGGEFHYLKDAFDENSNSYWMSKGKHKEEYHNIIENKTYDSLINNIIVSFSESVAVDRILYQSFSSSNCQGVGYPNELKIYYKSKETKGQLNGNKDDFILSDDILSESSGEKVLFKFNNTIKCDQIKLEWADIKSNCSQGYDGYASAAEIMFLLPENENLNENLLDAFEDYNQLTLTEKFNNKEMIDNLKKKIENIKYAENFKLFVNRIESIFNGTLKFDPKREFTTNLNSTSNPLYQRGDIDRYAKKTLKMKRAGTNRQITGIFGIPNETINVYVYTEEKDPLPSIRFSQFMGTSAKWLGKIMNLHKGKNIFKFDNFDMKDHTVITNPGGPIYLVNPYTPDLQSQNVKIYIEGGTLFPIFRLNDSEEEYKKTLNDYILILEKNNDTYIDITELYSDRAIISVKASTANEIYKKKDKGPQNNLIEWDEFIKKLYIFDGIQFEKDDTYYNENNKYVNIHFRYAQPYALAYAGMEHIGIYYDDWVETVIDIDTTKIDWGFPHEIGHMMDIDARLVSETSNNMISKFSDTFIKGDGTWGPDRNINKIKYLTPDDIDNKLRGCSSEDKNSCLGFMENIKLNYLVWWDLESFYHGYWGKIDNMYRYNSSSYSLSGLEKFVYFSNIILGLDLGYYFTRWGLYFDTFKIPFNENEVSEKYTLLMEEAINKGIINPTIKKKFWYLDYKEYNYMSYIGTGCYKDKNKYDIQIEKIWRSGVNQYIVYLPTIICPGHLGFEIYESEKLIGFSYEKIFVDPTVYDEDALPKYKIIAYDRLLDASNPSKYKTEKDKD